MRQLGHHCQWTLPSLRFFPASPSPCLPLQRFLLRPVIQRLCPWGHLLARFLECLQLQLKSFLPPRRVLLQRHHELPRACLLGRYLVARCSLRSHCQYFQTTSRSLLPLRATTMKVSFHRLNPLEELLRRLRYPDLPTIPLTDPLV